MPRTGCLLAAASEEVSLLTMVMCMSILSPKQAFKLLRLWSHLDYKVVRIFNIHVNWFLNFWLFHKTMLINKSSLIFVMFWFSLLSINKEVKGLRSHWEIKCIHTSLSFLSTHQNPRNQSSSLWAKSPLVILFYPSQFWQSLITNIIFWKVMKSPRDTEDYEGDEMLWQDETAPRLV